MKPKIAPTPLNANAQRMKAAISMVLRSLSAFWGAYELQFEASRRAVMFLVSRDDIFWIFYSSQSFGDLLREEKDLDRYGE